MAFPRLKEKINTIFSSVFELICINITRVLHSKNKMSLLQKDLRSICLYHRSKEKSEKLGLGITELTNTESRCTSKHMLSFSLKIIPFPQESSKAVTHRELPHASQKGIHTDVCRLRTQHFNSTKCHTGIIFKFPWLNMSLSDSCLDLLTACINVVKC